MGGQVLMEIPVIRAAIEHMRRQIPRQRREIRDLQRAGIPTTSAEELLGECSPRWMNFVLSATGS
jgi:hypothetical protein